MLRPPKRLSLVAQTVSILKEHIASGHAGEMLPSERDLCADMGVSRMTLRAALARLADDGLIQGGQGRRHLIAGVKKRQSSASSRNVIILSPVPLQEADPRVIFWIDELRDSLGKEDYKLEFLHNLNWYSKFPDHSLAELTSRMRPAAWLLYLSTHAMQEWFSKSKLPAVISGSRYSDVPLASVDVDYRAACRHAVGRFIALGHKRLVLLNPKSVAGGDLESEAGFREAGAGVETILVQHDGSVDNICNRLDRLLERRNHPTAFLISRPNHALTAWTHLVRRGIKFPQTAAFIARDHDSFLDHVVPVVARYQVDPVLFAHKLSRVVLEIASGGDASSRDTRIIPKLISGETLG